MKLSGTHSDSLKGPEPIAASFFDRSLALACATFCETIEALALAMYGKMVTFGCLSTNTTVRSSGVSTWSISVNRLLATDPSTLRIRSKVNFTSAEVSGSPLWNLAWRSLKLYVLPSCEIVHDSARSGCTLRSAVSDV